MAETIRCPRCARRLRAPELLPGDPVQCPGCGAIFAAPAPGAVPVAAGDGPAELEDGPVSVPGSPEAPFDLDDEPPAGVDRRRGRKRPAPHHARLIVTLGVIGLLTGAGLIVGPLAVLMARRDLAEMRAGRMDPSGRRATRFGLVCAAFALVLDLVVFCCCFPVFLHWYADWISSL
jgi:hypothetical protein